MFDLRLTPVALIGLALLMPGCRDNHQHRGKHGDGHDHPAPHGGTMVELKAHAIYLELLHIQKTGTLEIYVLKDHGTKPMAIAQETVDVTAKIADQSLELTLKASDDPLAGNKPGRTSVFEVADDRLKAEVSHVTVKSITVGGQTYKDKSAHLEHGPAD